MTLSFVVNSILLGVGLAMDAFSVSMANGLHDPHMGRMRQIGIAGTFGFFQFLMPMVGWFCVHRILEVFKVLEAFIPWIALLLLCWIGGNMLVEGIRGEDSEEMIGHSLGFGALMIQGIATSIDALSVGFTIADYGAGAAFAASVIIAVVTFGICMGGLRIGRVFGMKLAGKASIFGGVILVAIGIEIFVKHL